MRDPGRNLLVFLLLLSLYPLALTARPFFLILSQDDLKDVSAASPDELLDSADWDEFGDSESRSEEELDPGSWRPIFESDEPLTVGSDPEELYYSGVSKMMAAASSGEGRLMEEAVSEFEASAAAGYAHAQSALGFLYGTGQMRDRSKGKAFLCHHFAAVGGNMQSKMALAYTYMRQDAAQDSIMSGEAAQKSGVPQIIKSDMALKLAEQWVNNMTKIAEEEHTEAESEGRPSRLGLGAKFSRQVRPGPSNDPVERKMYANLQSAKRKAAKDAEESGLTARDPGGDSDVDDELESRASAFAKKRVITPPVYLTVKKKRR